MQKIEKWRIKELSIILDKIKRILGQGDCREWSNVFEHYCQESNRILHAEKQEIDALVMLIRNIKNCFSGLSSFANLSLRKQSSPDSEILDEDLEGCKTQLLLILDGMENDIHDYRH